MVEDGPRGGYPKEGTKMTNGVIFLALLGVWNGLCTVVFMSVMGLPWACSGV